MDTQDKVVFGSIAAIAALALFPIWRDPETGVGTDGYNYLYRWGFGKWPHVTEAEGINNCQGNVLCRQSLRF